MTKSTIAAELISVLKVKVAGEDGAELAERLARKGADAPDEVWETLSQEAQVWVNAAVEAIEGDKTLPALEGLEALLEGDDDGDEEEEVVTKTVKAKKAPKEAKTKKAEASGRGRKGKFAPDAKIKVIPAENPFRAGSKCFSWFSKIKSGMTVGEAIDAGAPRNHIRWAHTLGHLEIR